MANFYGSYIGFGSNADSGGADLRFGLTYGYSAGGYRGGYVNIIDYYPVASQVTAVDWGNLTLARNTLRGTSSATHGYCAGGHTGAPQSDVIDRFPWASNAGSADVGDLTIARGEDPGASQSTDFGYTHGGNGEDRIDRFQFVATFTATDVGNLTAGSAGFGGYSSLTHGYCIGGNAEKNRIDKYQHVATVNATDVANLFVGVVYTTNGIQSLTEGYACGGYNTGAGGYMNQIQKNNYTTDADGVDVGNLPQTGNSTAGCSSLTDGFIMGGGNAGGTMQVNKHNFDSGGDSTTWCDLSTGGGTSMAGLQH